MINKQKSLLKEMMKTYDLNQSGNLNKQEVREMAIALTKEVAPNIEVLDSDIDMIMQSACKHLYIFILIFISPYSLLCCPPPPFFFPPTFCICLLLLSYLIIYPHINIHTIYIGGKGECLISIQELPTVLSSVLTLRSQNAYFHELFVKHDISKKGYLQKEQLSDLIQGNMFIDKKRV